MADTSFTALKSGYTQCYQNCIINSSISDDPGNVATAISNNMSRYVTVSNALATKFPAGTPIPWYVIGFIHKMESDMNFGTHLHNGDPLTARTVHVPAGRPVNGNPPFTWEDSAADALQYAQFTQWSDWSVEGICYKLEAYNGFGYRMRGLNTPYLWSGTNQYTKGRFVADRQFDPNAVDRRIGAAAIMKYMDTNGLITIGAATASGSGTNNSSAPGLGTSTDAGTGTPVDAGAVIATDAGKGSLAGANTKSSDAGSDNSTNTATTSSTDAGTTTATDTVNATSTDTSTATSTDTGVQADPINTSNTQTSNTDDTQQTDASVQSGSSDASEAATP